MGRRMQLRAVTDEERQAVARLAHLRMAPARAVERARVVLAALEGQTVEDIAVDQRLARNTVYLWLHRFAERGVAGVPVPIRASRSAKSWRLPSRPLRRWAGRLPRGRSTGWWRI